MNQETIEFINKNTEANIHQIALQSARYPLVNIPLAIRQINGKQKIKSKVPLFYHNENILYPAQLSLEQSSSEATAKYKSELCQGKNLVDLTGGFGIDCYFMSKRFENVCYVERQLELCELAAHNFKVLNASHITVTNAKTEDFIQDMSLADWIYIDPARRSLSGKKVVLLSDCEPDVANLSSLLLQKATRIMIKLSPMMDISAVLKDLPNTAEIHIISVENECKEVLLILEQKKHSNPKIKTINIGRNNKNQLFEFNQNDETSSQINYCTALEKYLYEPNTSIMKSGAFKLIASFYGLKKLHTNTHLYTTSELLPEFPGRSFEVVQQWGNSKKELAELSKKIPKANISTRNYPLSVEKLQKKLKIKDGGDSYLFACTLANEEKCIIACIKVKPQIISNTETALKTN